MISVVKIYGGIFFSFLFHFGETGWGFLYYQHCIAVGSKTVIFF